ncbi:MAG: hypothetical protein K1X44_00245 [Alphaproteobacteria bacterium]|nr:hypothetical protein [Alphaproteobacteria bacterium]
MRVFKLLSFVALIFVYANIAYPLYSYAQTSTQKNVKVTKSKTGTKTIPVNKIQPSLTGQKKATLSNPVQSKKLSVVPLPAIKPTLSLEKPVPNPLPSQEPVQQKPLPAVTSAAPTLPTEVKTPVVNQKPLNLILQAKIGSEIKEIVGKPIFWAVSKANTNSGASNNNVITSTQLNPTLSLVPGRYLVTAKLGESLVTQTVDLTIDNQRVNVDFKPGLVKFNLIPVMGGTVIDKDVTWEVLRYAGPGRTDHQKIADSNIAQPEFILNEGYYIVRANYAHNSLDTVVGVQAQHRYVYTVNLYAGKVKLVAVPDKGEKLDQNSLITWEISSQSSLGKKIPLADTGNNSLITLKEGKYLVVARSGFLEGQTTIDVKSGSTQQIKVALKNKT